jgi:hypothetical protein
MPRLQRAMAACTAAAALAAVAAAPASAFDPDPLLTNCARDPSLPGCVNYVFDVSQRTIEVVRDTYNYEVQPVLNDPACEGYKIVNDTDDCPSDLVPHL